MANEIHLNDIGHVFEVTVMDDEVPRNISGASAIIFYLRDPDGNVSEHAGSLSGTGIDGKCEYATIADDLDQVGWWEIQVGITEGATPIFKTAVGSFEVKGNLS